MKSPLIGITIQRLEGAPYSEYQGVRDSYIQSVLRAGGIPLLIPVGISNRMLEDLAPRLDGLLLTGGGDIDPRRFRGKSHPKIFGVDPERDRLEIHLVRYVVRARIPFLAICRGIQVVNVALGGSLYTDIDDQYPNAMQHQYSSLTEREFLAHRVDLVKNSLLWQILQNSPFWVNSLHHQGLRRLGEGLKSNAYTPDNLVEGVELLNHPYGLGVQWHPECLTDSPQTLALFDSFIRAAEDRLL